MLRNITIGQYLAGNSVIHNLDPRMKIIITIMMITALFFIDIFLGYALFFLAVIIIVYLSRIPPIRILRGLKPVLFLVMLTLILHVFLQRVETLSGAGVLFPLSQRAFIQVSSW